MLANSNKATAFIHSTGSGHLAIVNLFIRKKAKFSINKTARFTDLMAARLMAC
jgi:hypothetical protein